jgi:hypothetical protein
MPSQNYIKLKTTRTKGYENMDVTGCLFSNYHYLQKIEIKFYLAVPSEKKSFQFF